MLINYRKIQKIIQKYKRKIWKKSSSESLIWNFSSLLTSSKYLFNVTLTLLANAENWFFNSVQIVLRQILKKKNTIFLSMFYQYGFNFKIIIRPLNHNEYIHLKSLNMFYTCEHAKPWKDFILNKYISQINKQNNIQGKLT